MPSRLDRFGFNARRGVSIAGRHLMWLETIITREDLREMLVRLMPLEVRLGDEGELKLSHLMDVSFLESRGLHVKCRAEIKWPVLGMNVPVTLTSVSVVLCPYIDKRPEG